MNEMDILNLHNTDDITIRFMQETDAQILTDEEVKQGDHTSIKKYLKRIKDHHEGRAFALVAVYKGNVAGYLSVYKHIKHGPFKDTSHPELVDFGVLKKYRRLGIGNKLMDVAEAIASKYSDIVCLGVGLHSGYGSAQRMYIKRGYIPDGSGVWYQNEICTPYTDCVNNDDLVLYMSKVMK